MATLDFTMFTPFGEPAAITLVNDLATYGGYTNPVGNPTTMSYIDYLAIGCENLACTNIPIIADAGPDQNVFTNEFITLNGSGSTETPGYVHDYFWEQTMGSAVTLSDAYALTPSFIASVAPQILEFRLTVNNDGGSSDSDLVQINVSAVPVPSAFWLFGSGLLGLAGIVRSRNAT
ncbi:MAG: hypothetical protein OEY45_06890 [Gammaproteobacteria bacterium]|nr:hypothetical protein [Gammaproteobacteria bacterium]